MANSPKCIEPKKLPICISKNIFSVFLSETLCGQLYFSFKGLLELYHRPSQNVSVHFIDISFAKFV